MRFESFSERYGYIKVDDALQIGKMNDALQNVLRSYLYKIYINYDNLHSPSKTFLELLFEYYLKLPYTQIPTNYGLRGSFFDGFCSKASWNQMYDLVEFVYFFYQHTRKSSWILEDYTKKINDILEREHSGYRLIDGQITPITDENEIASIKEAIDENLLDTAKTQIQEALTKLSDREHPDYRNSIKESISAVETICRYITGESTLDNALPKLKNKGIIIPDMLYEGMKKIYYFTNGTDGIRHALMDENSSIDFDEAKYMLVSCSAFINYLKGKLGKANA